MRQRLSAVLLTPGRRAPWALLVGVIAAAAYAPTLGHRLVWDDPGIVEHVESVVRADGPAALLTAEFRLDVNDPARLGYFRPVVLLSFWLDSLLFDGAAWGYHATNILLHAGNAVLVFLLLAAAGTGVGGAAFGGALFAVHPVHTESVAFVSGRTDLWAGAFGLIACLAWLHDRRGAARHPRAIRAAGFLAFLLALLSKELVLLLPVVLLFWDAVEPRGDGEPPRGRLSGNGTWVLLWAAACAIAWFLRWHVAGVGFGAGTDQGPTFRADLAARPDLIPLVWSTYLRLLTLPWPLSANYTVADLTWSGANLGGALLALAACLGLAARKHRRAGLVGLAWIAAFLAPVSGIVPLAGSIVAERYLYLPSVGWCLVVGHVYQRFARTATFRAALTPAAAALVAGFFLATAARSRIWRDDLSLYRDMAATSPASVIAQFNLGKAYGENGMPEQAAAAYRRAIAISPSSADVYLGLGEVLLGQGKAGEALLVFADAVRRGAGSVEIHSAMATVHLGLGEYKEAAAASARALALRPEYAQALNSLGVAASNLGRPQEALDAFRRAVASDAGCAGCFHNLGLEYEKLGRLDEARISRREAARLDPRYAVAVEGAGVRDKDPFAGNDDRSLPGRRGAR